MTTKAAATEVLNLFIPLDKVDEERREVWGVLAEEALDKTAPIPEIMDYESSKPHFEAWSKYFSDATDGKSLGNLRAMHKAISAGKLIALQFDDPAKKVRIGAKVVDDQEWAKVMEGVYTGFSVGGSYLDPKLVKVGGKDARRYTAKPSEASLADLPCMPGAVFEMVRTGGATELRKLRSVDDPAPVVAAEPLAKDAPAVIALSNDALTALKALAAEMALMPGEPDTWTLDGILSAIRATVQAKASAEGAVADEAIVAADGGTGTPVTSSPATGSAQGTPAAKIVEPAAPAPVVEPPPATLETTSGPTTEEVVTKIVAAPLGEVRDLLTKLVTLQEAGGPKNEGLRADLAKVTESMGSIEGRLAKMEKIPAPIGRPAQKVLGSGDPEPGTADVGAIRKAVDTLAASGQLSPLEERQARILLATVEARKL